MRSAAGTPVVIHDDADTLGEALAREILDGIVASGPGRRYLLGCPGGRSLRSTYAALARLMPPDSDLRPLVIVMMDEYVVETADGPRRIDPGEHYSCAGFATREIVAALDAVAAPGRGVLPEHVWVPDASDPGAYERRIEDAGGVDLFLAASGAGDGHVAFVAPGAPFDQRTAVVELAEQTRRDNMITFPDFGSLEEVPRRGVSVGLSTIAGHSRSVCLVLLGASKRVSVSRVLAATDFDPSWPATFIHRCPEPRIMIDRDAAGER